MLSILGVGYAYPDTIITNDTLTGLFDPKSGSAGAFAAALKESGISSRRTTLPLSYLEETGNIDPWQTKAMALQNPTDLSERAARLAIERAGITPEQIGLVLGETSTSLQTTPSEAQRLGQRLGFKRTPAYDLLGSSGTFLLHLQTLLSWKDEEVPDYVLLVSSNTPTQSVNYRSTAAGVLLGDAAYCIVVAPRAAGKLRVVDAEFHTVPKQSQNFTIPLYGSVEMNFDAFNSFIREHAARLGAGAIKKNNLDPEKTTFVGPQGYASHLQELGKELRIPSEKIISNVAVCGYSLGAAPGAILGEHWDTIVRGEKILVVCAGGGSTYGYVVLSAE